MGDMIVRIGKVEYVENKYTEGGSDGNRIKVRLDEGDKTYRTKDDLPWCFPLLPKTFQSTPQEGESVFVITAQGGDVDSQRYYIGPVISQPQYFEKAPHDTSTSLIEGGKFSPLPKMSMNANSDGAFPSVRDVAVIGRGQEDVMLRYVPSTMSSEVDIRAGIRQADLTDLESVGNTEYNASDPAYIQVKHKPGLSTAGNSVVNIVADNVNIMSNYDNDVSRNIHDHDDLVVGENTDDVIRSLHQVPHGDALVELLKIIKGALLEHVHGICGGRQKGDNSGFIDKLKDYNIDSILSQYVRVS